jgi:adenylosuccinate synthase
VFHGIKSIIGPGCVVNPAQFFKELKELQAGGIDIDNKIFIAKNAHVITNSHLEEENNETKIGTTKRGNGPAYRDKYARVGTQASAIPSLRPYLIDLYEEFHGDETIKVLCEGAQGYSLDVDWGDYPYVTSSHCGVAGALLNAVPYTWVRDVWGVGKVYETYVGAKQFEPVENSEFFARLREAGGEYGATTGRPRQCRYLNLDAIRKAINMNGANKLVLNKVDVLRILNTWKLVNNNELLSFESEKQFTEFIKSQIPDVEIFFSDTKYKI